MANKNLFQTVRGLFSPKGDTVNEAGGLAYELQPKAALAQYAATGCFSHTFYADASEQLEKVLALAKDLDTEFVAKTAIFAREKGFMKDMPALLLAVLSTKDKELLERVFPRVIKNGKMLRNFVQIMRSGAVGRKSLGSLPKRLVREWFENRKAEQIFKQSVGQAPSFADVLKMVHPKPQDAEKEALCGYFIGRDVDADKLPEIVRKFERFKRGDSLEMPDVPFQMLTALPISTKEWTEIARNAGWQMTRMNLNTFQRHGVFADAEMVELIASRMRDRASIQRARVFPYQLLAAYTAASQNAEIPRKITEALQDALEIATENVPEIKGKVYVFPDISGSMHSAVTGYRKGATSLVRCLDVAALVAAASFFSTEKLKKQSNFVVHQKSLNWHPHNFINALHLISITVQNILCFLKTVNHEQSSELQYLIPNDDEFYKRPWENQTGSIMNLSLNSRVNIDVVEPLSNDEILDFYKK